MSLPKRDGVHDRYYLIHKPDTSLCVIRWMIIFCAFPCLES